ncbi:MAG: hypothetical protein OXI79_20310 [Gammaproteobacteria bacterium]|nr:hypothetical protein [Gammaproteobacteria bacterium]
MTLAAYSPRETAFDVYRRIMDSLVARSPLSVIRLGDGEGTLLGYPEIIGRRDVEYFMGRWMRDEADVGEELVGRLVSELREAVVEADVLGLPRHRQEISDPRWAAVRQAVNMHGLLSRHPSITHTCLHRAMQHALLFRPLLADRDFLGIVTPRDVSDRLCRLFRIRRVVWYGVRGALDEPGEVGMRHYPEGFEWMEEKLRVPYPGALFLVGAGPWGKIYCSWIKRRGGVAVDIGSLFDSWAGVGRVGHPVRSLDVYEELPRISREQAVRRYNGLIAHFELDIRQAGAEQGLPDAW